MHVTAGDFSIFGNLSLKAIVQLHQKSRRVCMADMYTIASIFHRGYMNCILFSLIVFFFFFFATWKHEGVAVKMMCKIKQRIISF